MSHKKTCTAKPFLGSNNMQGSLIIRAQYSECRNHKEMLHNPVLNITALMGEGGREGGKGREGRGGREGGGGGRLTQVSEVRFLLQEDLR